MVFIRKVPHKPHITKKFYYTGWWAFAFESLSFPNSASSYFVTCISLIAFIHLIHSLNFQRNTGGFAFQWLWGIMDQISEIGTAPENQDILLQNVAKNSSFLSGNDNKKKVLAILSAKKVKTPPRAALHKGTLLNQNSADEHFRLCISCV